MEKKSNILAAPLTLDGLTIPNRLAIQPMEGCDGTNDGAPGELTRRRYLRFAGSGAGLIWMEATAVVAEGRANPRQLMLTEKNLDNFKMLVNDIKETAIHETGIEPVLILQLTHSGRYSKPDGTAWPIIARNNPLFEINGALDTSCIASDDYLAELPSYYATAAVLAEKAGFDGVDVKACHGYLLNELLAAHTRPGIYGGGFKNRTRLFRESIQAVRAVSDNFTTARLNVYDGFALPYGWGADCEGQPDLDEPVQLAQWMVDEAGIPLVNVTIGNPYVNPHVNRPYNKGGYVSPEAPMDGVHRLCDCAAELKKRVPQLAVIASGLSYPREKAADLATEMVESGAVDMVGFGRLAIANPNFAKEILAGQLKEKDCCIACSKCSELMRVGSMAGCVVRDNAMYAPLYMENVKRKL